MLKKKLLETSGIYLVTDRRALNGKDITLTISQALKAGIDIIQYRDKEATDREFLETGKKIKDLLSKKDVLFIVDDRVEVALALDADGVHLGQEDMPVKVARSILGTKKIIGLSTHSMRQMREGGKLDVDYISVGPVFSTPTKPDYRAIGLELIEIASQELKIPFVAIGGIDESNIEDVSRAGARRIAVVRAILSSKDPFAAAKGLREVLKA
ncbi:thiamine phosphate synthase [Candidatus Omnitrophota bacterium]